MATIKDVAKLAGVSVSTASVALSGKGPVSDSTRRRYSKRRRPSLTGPTRSHGAS